MPSSGMTQMPMLAPTKTSRPLDRMKGRLISSIRACATVPARSGSSRFSSTTTNSSPPMRASMSHWRTRLSIRVTAICSSSSPAAWQTVIDGAEMVEVDHQGGGIAAVQLQLADRMGQPRGQQQPVGQVGQGIVVGDMVELEFGLLDGADVGEGSDVIGGLAEVVLDGGYGQPLRKDFSRFAAVPDFPLPIAVGRYVFEHGAVERRVMMARFHQPHIGAQQLVR